MKLKYRGAYRDHGTHTIHDSSEVRQSPKGQRLATNKKSVVVSSEVEGVTLRFDGTANLNRNADYEFSITLSDQELLELFQLRFGCETTVLHVQKELFGEMYKQRMAAGLPAPVLQLPAPKGWS